MVNPFYGVGPIVINEICANPDYLELFNYGSNVDMTGWSLQIYDADTLYNTYTFPIGWIFSGHKVVILHEFSGTDTEIDLYTGWNIPWTSDSIAVGLFDETGAHVDWVQTSTFSGLRPNNIEWEQDVSLVVFNNDLRRVTDKDTNKASDWIVASSGTPGSLNPGQSGIGYVSVEYLNPQETVVQYSGGITFSWRSLEVPFGSVNYTLQISNSADFSTILLEVSNITETSNITLIDIVVDLSPGKYYWRVHLTYESYYSNSSNYFSFTIEPAPIGFFEKYWVYLLIVGGSVVVLVFLRKKLKRKRKIQLGPIFSSKKVLITKEFG